MVNVKVSVLLRFCQIEEGVVQLANAKVALPILTLVQVAIPQSLTYMRVVVIQTVLKELMPILHLSALTAQITVLCVLHNQPAPSVKKTFTCKLIQVVAYQIVQQGTLAL